jgi:hypothetical protein
MEQIMSDEPRLSSEDLEAEAGTALPNKEVISLLDLNIDLDAALDLAAPIDLAVAANANVAAPINAAVSANVLSIGSESAAMATQSGTIDQGISGEAIANAPQTSSIDQGNDVIDDGTTTTPTDDGTVTAPTPSPEALLDGDLLNIDANIGIDADVAAPVAGAVAANANVAAPIDAAVSANVASALSSSAALADQDVTINQHLDDVTAEATADQDSDITQ